MITDIEILEIIDEYKNSYDVPKSNDRSSMLTFLCLYIKRQNEEIYLTFLSFFLKEISVNTYGYQDLSIDILKKMNEPKTIPIIYKIFCKQLYSEVLSYSVSMKIGKLFILLMSLHDATLLHAPTYYNYIENNAKKMLFKSKSHIALKIIVMYLQFNKEHAIEILSDYYKQELSTYSIEIKSDNSNIFIPCNFFIENNSFDIMSNLIQITYKKEELSGKQLYKLFMDYAKHSNCQNREDYNKRQEMIKQLTEIKF